jgi:hypothetical protein
MALTADNFWIADIDIAPRASTAAMVLGIAALKAHLIAGSSWRCSRLRARGRSR